MLMNGYWMLSNKQIFDNEISSIDFNDQGMVSKHFIGKKVTASSPMQLMCVAAVFLIAIQKIFSEQLQRLGFSLQAQDIEVDEDLPPFFNVIKLSQANMILSQEKNMRENFGFNIYDGDTIDALNNAKNPKKPIVGTPWYAPLSNPLYSQRFGYIGSFVSERYKLLENDQDPPQDDEGNDIWTPEIIRSREEQSDLVMILLNLAYIPDSVISSIENFDHGWS